MRTILMCLWFVSIECGDNTFQPNSSWQTIEEGQAIPPGLHVRINLETGKKEAKLLDKNDPPDSNESSSLMELEKIRTGSVDIEDLKDALKNLKKDPTPEESSPGKQFKSYDELKSEFKSMNMDIQTDFEILTEYVTDFNLVVAESGSYDSKNLIAILKEIEYLVHQYDNAVEFARLSGFETLVLPTLNKTNDNEIKALVLRIVGSASQSNPKVQLTAVEAGCINALLKILALEQTSKIRLRCIFALSCILRSFPKGQKKFVLQGGVSVLTSLFDDAKRIDEIMRLKVTNMLTDIILESQGIFDNSKRKSQYEEIGLEQSLRDTGWCKRVPDWMAAQVNWQVVASLREEDVNHEMVAGAADFIQALAETCLADYVTNIYLMNTVNHAKTFYSDLALVEAEDGNGDSYYGDILQKLRLLAATFARNSQFRDEL